MQSRGESFKTCKDEDEENKGQPNLQQDQFQSGHVYEFEIKEENFSVENVDDNLQDLSK